MARRFTIEVLMDLAKAIGANPQKFMGTKTNISFLGKGPTRNPLFQGLLPGPETSKVLLGPERIEGTISAVNDAMGYASAGKLNSIQTEMLGKNLLGLKDILHPPVLPSASVTPIRSGIKTVAPKPRSDIDRLLQEGYTDARGRRWDFGGGERRYNKLTGLNKPRLVENRLPGPGFASDAYTTSMLNAKTAWSRSIARQLLQQDTRLKLNPEELYSLRTGARGADPLELMKKYYGRSVDNLDEFLNYAEIRNPDAIKDIATRILAEVKLTPAFAEGGLARILEL